MEFITLVNFDINDSFSADNALIAAAQELDLDLHATNGPEWNIGGNGCLMVDDSSDDGARLVQHLEDGGWERR